MESSGVDAPPGGPASFIGQRVLGYELTALLGGGAQGAAYLAVHHTLGQRAVVKILHAHFASSAAFVSRFLHEGQALSRVSHPGIVKIYDQDRLPDGPLYILMEHLDGQLLHTALAGLARPAALRLLAQVAAAMDAAHRRGVIHRDLKPDNIQVVSDPEVEGGLRTKVFDFGIAHLDGATQLTQAGAMMGTPAYMAPEQWQGSQVIDGAADVYALGVMLYEVLAGHRPFEASSLPALFHQHVHLPPPALTAAPAAVSDLVNAMLAKEPARRPAMAQVRAALLAVLAESDAVAVRPRRSGRAWFRRGSALLGLLLALVVGTYAARRGTAPPPPPGMLLLPAARFTMGSTTAEIAAAQAQCQQQIPGGCRDEIFTREQPARLVHVSAVFLDVTEVDNQALSTWLDGQQGLTVARERLVLSDGVPLVDLAPPQAGIRRGADGRFTPVPGRGADPAVQVSWYGARRYCEGRGARLPTEAEWERAARVRPAGLRSHGAEWVADRFAAPYPPCGPCRDPLAPEDGPPDAARVIRGADPAGPAVFARPAARSRRPAREALQNVGFRCARSALPQDTR